MLRIFEKADKVIAWLQTSATWGPGCMFEPNEWSEVMHNETCASGWSFLQESLSSVASNEIWQRTWCRQEIFAAKTLLLMGPRFVDQTTDVKSFADFLHRICRFNDRHIPSAVGPKVRVSRTFEVMLQNYRHAGTGDYDYQASDSKIRYTYHWLSHLRTGSSFQVSDDRDRAYAIVGMVNSPTTRFYVESRPDIDVAKLPISYAKSVSEVYQDLIKYLINTDRNLDCLTVFEDRTMRDLPDDLPSWVTDWRLDQPRSLLLLLPDREQDREGYGVPPVQDLYETDRLHLEAHFFCKIHELNNYGIAACPDRPYFYIFMVQIIARSEDFPTWNHWPQEMTWTTFKISMEA